MMFLIISTNADYGSSFSDVVQGLEHVLETLGSDQISVPSSFKYRVALEKQVVFVKKFTVKWHFHRLCF